MEKLNNKMRTIIILLFISSFSLLLSFWGDYNGNVLNIIIAYAIPILFWGGMILAYEMLYQFNKQRIKNAEAEKPLNNNSERTHNRIMRPTRFMPGALRIISNKYATIFDFLSLIFLILVIVLSFIPNVNQVIVIVCLSVLVFSLQMHCLLNGVNFTYILLKRR